MGVERRARRESTTRSPARPRRRRRSSRPARRRDEPAVQRQPLQGPEPALVVARRLSVSLVSRLSPRRAGRGSRPSRRRRSRSSRRPGRRPGSPRARRRRARRSSWAAPRRPSCRTSRGRLRLAHRADLRRRPPTRRRSAGLATPTPIIESRVTSSASFSTGRPSVPSGTLRQHHVAQRRRAVPHPDLLRPVDLQPELPQHRAGLHDDARPVGGVLVPCRRQTEHRPRVARAERADDDVVDVRRALQHDDLGALRAAEAKLGYGLRAVLQQAPPVVGIDPRPAPRPSRRSAGRCPARTCAPPRRSRRW